MADTLLLMLLASALTTIFFVVTHKHRIPNLSLDEEALPGIEEGLPLIAGLATGTVHRHNAAQVFQNGGLLDAALDDIQRAKRTIHLETFVWKSGTVERRFVDLLCRKAQEGVKVRVLADFLGSKDADESQLAKLRASGAVFVSDRRIRWFDIRRFNNRMHRKILIIDGEVGYTFGHGIADEWLGEGENSAHWRDTGIRLKGGIVLSLQSIFAKDWISAQGEIPIGDGCFPQSPASGAVAAHVVSSSAGDAYSSVALLYMLAIACAEKEVIIQNPYFTPDPAIPRLLRRAAKKGVAVHLMVPGEHTDSHFVRRAGQRLYRRMLKSGVRIHEFEPTLLHQKIVVIDGCWSHIGSTNFDARSLALNAEIGVGLLDKTVASDLREAFNNDLQYSRELTFADWEKRAWYQHALDWGAYQLHGQI